MIQETLQIIETDLQPWMIRAACAADHDPDLWYPDYSLPLQVRRDRTKRAVRICMDCPVRYECLRWAYEVGDEHGILGGLTKNQRSRIRNRVLRSRELANEEKARRANERA